MTHSDMSRHTTPPPAWLLALTVAAGMALILIFKVPGIFLALGLLGFVFLASKRTDDIEIDALVSSIALSAEDIGDVLAEFDAFCNAHDAHNLEDRTLLRPALADRDSTIPEIVQFHEDYANAQRYLHRLPARLTAPLSVNQAERLLRITDERAELLRASWLEARRVAREHGPS